MQRPHTLLFAAFVAQPVKKDIVTTYAASAFLLDLSDVVPIRNLSEIRDVDNSVAAFADKMTVLAHICIEAFLTVYDSN